MIDILRAVGDRSERAVQRALFAVAGAGLLVAALGFASAAIVEALASLMPRYAALAIGALFLGLGAAILLALSRRKDAPPAPPQTGTGSQAAFTAPGDWRSALHLALVEEAQERPARAAALAALAGLVLGALEGFDDARKEKPHDA